MCAKHEHEFAHSNPPSHHHLPWFLTSGCHPISLSLRHHVLPREAIIKYPYPQLSFEAHQNLASTLPGTRYLVQVLGVSNWFIFLADMKSAQPPAAHPTIPNERIGSIAQRLAFCLLCTWFLVQVPDSQCWIHREHLSPWRRRLMIAMCESRRFLSNPKLFSRASVRPQNTMDIRRPFLLTIFLDVKCYQFFIS